jgi:LPS-assembly protein
MSFKLGQRHFFDSTFGGAIRESSINQFYPLNSLTGIPYAIGERDYSPLTAVVRFNPNLKTNFDIRSDYDTEIGDFRNISVTGFWRPGSFSVATTYLVTGELTEDFDRRNQIQGRISIGNANRGLSAFGGFSLDLQDSKLLNHNFRASYYWDCCGISAEILGFNLRSREETQVRFSFFLKGIGIFGTIRRPDNIF